MVLGGLALLLSGLVLVVRSGDSSGAARAFVPLRSLIHAVAALVTIGGFIVHLYMGLAVVPGGLSAILHGEVTEEWARRHHPLWNADSKK